MCCMDYCICRMWPLYVLYGPVDVLRGLLYLLFETTLYVVWTVDVLCDLLHWSYGTMYVVYGPVDVLYGLLHLSCGNTLRGVWNILCTV